MDADPRMFRLPDGSGCFTASMPLPTDHWLYAPRAEGWDRERDCSPDVPHPILTRELQEAVWAAVRYGVRAATDCGREKNFDPDALVQNITYALCGPAKPMARVERLEAKVMGDGR